MKWTISIAIAILVIIAYWIISKICKYIDDAFKLEYGTAIMILTALIIVTFIVHWLVY